MHPQLTLIVANSTSPTSAEPPTTTASCRPTQPPAAATPTAGRPVAGAPVTLIRRLRGRLAQTHPAAR